MDRTNSTGRSSWLLESIVGSPTGSGTGRCAWSPRSNRCCRSPDVPGSGRGRASPRSAGGRVPSGNLQQRQPGPAHRIGHGVHPDPPALGAVGVDARRAVGASGGLEQLAHPPIELRATPLPRRRAAVAPFVNHETLTPSNGQLELNRSAHHWDERSRLLSPENGIGSAIEVVE